jgi:hypothetical protein
MIDLQITEVSQLVFLFFFFMCVIWVVYCLISFINELNKQRLHLSDLDIELQSEQLDIPLRKGRVTYLRRKVPEAKGIHRKLDEYALELRDLDEQIEEAENEKRGMEQKRREEEEARGRIKLREWDF